MRIVVIGGTGFIGTCVVEKLIDMGHDILVFSRHQNNLSRAYNLIGNRDDLSNYVPDFKRFNPDIVIDMIAYTKRDAQNLIETFRGIVHRVVVTSSQDVYRAYGLIKHLEIGGLQSLPITEKSTLRSQLHPYGGEYEKILVEQVVMSSPEMNGTILRLPAVYGPHDYAHRFNNFLQRMNDQRPFILLQREYAQFRQTHGYVENVSDAITLAATNEKASGRIYNVGEASTLSTAERVVTLGKLVGWTGLVVEVDSGLLPKNMIRDFRMNQHWIVSSDRIRAELDYKENVSFLEGLRRTVDWELANPVNNTEQLLTDYSIEDGIYAKII